MNRRRFIKLAAMAGAALGLATRAEAQPEPINAYAQPPRGIPHPPKLYIVDNRGNYEGLARDSRMFEEFARFEFRKREMWPRNAQIVNIEAPRDIDAL